MVFVPFDEVVVVFVPFEACSSRWKVVEAFEDACEGLIKQTRSHTTRSLIIVNKVSHKATNHGFRRRLSEK